MRKAVFMLIAVMLFQLSWSVAAAYCLHETERTARHFGHHEAEHGASASVPDADDGKSSGVSGNDCAACHLTHAGMVFPPPTDVSSPRVTIHRSDHDAFSPTRAPDAPERPHWLDAA